MKADKIPCMIYADFKSLIKEIDRSVNNPKISLTTKIGEHAPCGYSMSANIVRKNFEFL